MGKYTMVVQSQAKPGRDDDYNAWYDSQHFADISALPGVVSGKRLEATPIMLGEPGLNYLSLFEIETDDPGAFMAEMGRRSAEGLIPGTDALDQQAVRLWIYKVSDKYA